MMSGHRRMLAVWVAVLLALGGLLYQNTQEARARDRLAEDTAELARRTARLVRENRRLEKENCRGILTLSRNLFSPLPEPPLPGELRDYTQIYLPPFYYVQYRQMIDAFMLEERCGDGLPPATPPPPTPPPGFEPEVVEPTPPPPASSPPPETTAPSDDDEPPGRARGRDTTPTTRPERNPLVCLPLVGCVG
jgi:hypothetical protein